MIADADWAWSYSRSRALKDCPRAFSYALDRGIQQGGTSATPIGAVIGICVHEAVDAFISAQVGGVPLSLHRLRAEGERRFDAIWEHRTTRIIELSNGANEDAIQPVRFKRAIRERLDRFYQFIWPVFKGARHECHEEPAEFSIHGHRVRFQIDFACWTADGQLQIVDWKTGGAENQRGGEIQLAVYSLWAHERFRIPPQDIKPIIASLLNGRIVEYDVTPYDLDYIDELVRDDYEAVEKYRRSQLFPASPNLDRCTSCRFLQRCHDGQEIVFDST